MPVSITWSSTNGGSAVSQPIDHGNDNAGNTMAAQEFFIEHDGDNPITDCGFYIAIKTGTYGGDFSALADLEEMLAWGDSEETNGYGGFQINMDATGSYVGLWPTVGDKSGSTYNTFRTNIGDSAENKILLATQMGLSGGVGTIQAGTGPNVRFKCRVRVPNDTTEVGTRQFEQRLRYTYTS